MALIAEKEKGEEGRRGKKREKEKGEG